MDDWAALRLALEMVHMPWRVRLVRSQPLPDGVPLVLQVATGDPEREKAAVEATGRSGDAVRRAATFFIEQVLLAPDADSYRVLGASPSATSGELRQNLASLMRWLHPDIAHQGEPSIFAARIAAAWNNLKTADRRAAYDSEQQASAAFRGRTRGKGAMSDEASQWASHESRLRSQGSRRFRTSRGRAKSRLPRVLAFLLLGRPMH